MNIMRMLFSAISFGLFFSGAAGAQNGSLEVTPEKIFSNFECTIDAPIENVYAALADVKSHNRILSNIVSRTIVDPSELGSVLKENEILTISAVVEPEERLALAIFRLFPPNRIEEEMLTDPFDGAEEGDPGTLDKKKGKIAWNLEPNGGSTVMNVESEFAPKTGRVYTAERVNRIWSSHCDMLQVESNAR